MSSESSATLGSNERSVLSKYGADEDAEEAAVEDDDDQDEDAA